MSMSEKCNTLHRLLHFNFCGICDQSVMSLTPSGDPQPIKLQTPKAQEMGRVGCKVAAAVGRGDAFDWWWCELNRKRLRESFYQARNTSGLKCSCTTPLYNAAAWPHIARRQKPRWELLVIIAPSSTHHVKLCWSRKTVQKHDTGLKTELQRFVDSPKCVVLVIFEAGPCLSNVSTLLISIFKMHVFSFELDKKKTFWIEVNFWWINAKRNVS